MRQFFVSHIGPVVAVCFCALIAQESAAQGPVRNLARDLKAQRADYPGPIAYAPNDPDTRSKRYRMQTGHYGFFYNCDGEECKRHSPYINWGAQNGPDWRNGWRVALCLDRKDVIQRIRDGACLDDQCTGCSSCNQSNVVPTGGYYGASKPAASGGYRQASTPRQPITGTAARTAKQPLLNSSGVQVSNRMPILNSLSLGRNAKLSHPSNQVAAPKSSAAKQAPVQNRTARQRRLLDIR